MYLLDRYTNKKLEFIVSDGSFGFIDTDKDTDLEPVIKDIVTKKFYTLFVYDGNIGWEETQERPKQHLELIDKVTSKLVEVYLYDSSLAWKEKYIPVGGTVKKLFQKKIYVPRRAEFNVDAVIAIQYNIEKKIKGIVSFLSSNLYNIIGWSKIRDYITGKMLGIKKISDKFIGNFFGVNKTNIHSSFYLPSRYKLEESKRISVSSVSAYLEKKHNSFKGIRQISTNKVIDFSGYRNDKIKKNIQFNIKGGKDMSSILLAVGLIK